MPVEVVRETGGLTQIRMSWPDRRNALGPDDARQLGDVLSEEASHKDTKVLMLTAEGPAFCAGGHLEKILALAAEGETALREGVYSSFQGLYRVLTDSPVPVIAVVEGPAIGLGCDLALACDLRIAGPRASFVYGWGRLGLIAATGGIYEMRRLVNTQRLWRFIAGDAIDQAEAQAIGLAHAADASLHEARRLGQELALLGREALLSTVRLSREPSAARYLDFAVDTQVRLLTAPEFAERASRVLARSSARGASPGEARSP